MSILKKLSDQTIVLNNSNNNKSRKKSQSEMVFQKHFDFIKSKHLNNKQDMKLHEMENELNKLETNMPRKKDTNFKKTKFTEMRKKRSKSSSSIRMQEELRNKAEENYLFFLVHGLEATSFDMRHIRAAVLANIPNSSVCFIQKNHDLTNDTIENQGSRFAEEVQNLLKTNKFSSNFFFKYS
jgi:hypothetical protein